MLRCCKLNEGQFERLQEQPQAKHQVMDMYHMLQNICNYPAQQDN